MKKLLNKNNRGLITAIDLILSIAIASLISISLLKFMIDQEKTKVYQSASDNVSSIAKASNKYITNRFNSFINLYSASGAANDLGPRVCDSSTSTCYFTEQTLINDGYLPKGFKDDPNSGGYIGFVSITGTNPNTIIDGYLISKNQYGQNPLLTTGMPNINSLVNVPLASVIKLSGVDAGFSSYTSGNIIANSPWNWNIDIPIVNSLLQTPYNNHLIYKIGFGSSGFSLDYSKFMKLDGSTSMQASLNMGGNSIYGAHVIHLSNVSANAIEATSNLVINKEESGTVYNSNTNLANKVNITGSLNVGTTTLQSNLNQLLLTTSGPTVVTQQSGTGVGNTTVQGNVNLLEVVAESFNANMSDSLNSNNNVQESDINVSNSSYIYSNFYYTRKTLSLNNASFINNINGTSHFGSINGNGDLISNVASGTDTINNLKTSSLLNLTNSSLYINRLYVLNSSGINTNNMSAYKNGTINFSSLDCVNQGSNTKCGSNLNLNNIGSFSNATLTNYQTPYTTCGSSDGSSVLGMLAVSRTDGSMLLSCSNIANGSSIWVPVSKGARTYTYIGQNSVYCPSDTTYVTGGASCSSGSISSGGQNGNGYSNASCSAGTLNVVIICRY